MDTPEAIIRRLGGPSHVAAALDISSPSTVMKWGARQSIPLRYWPALMRLGATTGGLTLCDLFKAHTSPEGI